MPRARSRATDTAAAPAVRLRHLGAAWRPPAAPRAVEWIPRHIVIPDETETPGRFDLDLFPHVREILEAVDDPQVRTILLRWAARNAKTTTALAVLVFLCANAPRPALFASSNEDRADDTIRTQLWPLLEACDEVRDQLPPPHRRTTTSIRLGRCRIRRAFSGSASTLAGFPAAYVVADEISKWASRKSTEADPIHLVKQRAKLFPFDSKLIFASTPGTAGRCHITAMVEAEGVDRRTRWIPCPHCGTWQRLVFGTADEQSPGITWPKDRQGRSDPVRAEAEAWYRCEKGCKIASEERAAPLRAGRWLSTGQSVRGDKLVGPRPAASTVAFDALSSLYSLVVSGWGQIAREFLEARASREGLRDFANSTLCEVWDPKPRGLPVEEVAQRLCVGIPREIAPPWTVFLTAAVDCQEEATVFPWVVCAWGPGGRGHLVSWGRVEGWDRVRQVLARPWALPEGPPRLLPSLALVDSGDERSEVYRFCVTLPRCLPCKGSSTPLVKLYDPTVLDEWSGLTLIRVNTDESQQWIQRLLDGVTTPENPAWFSLPTEAAFDLELLDELVNEVLVEDVNAKGRETKQWVRRHKSRPNDFRDALRYAWTAAQVVTQNGTLWDRLPTGPVRTIDPTSAASPVVSGGERRPDGRPWV